MNLIQRYGAITITSALIGGAIALTAGCSSSNSNAKTAEDPIVAVATASKAPQPITISGLGHVQGFDTAAARAQTGGQLISIGFAEGQVVHVGQPLAQIDPRPLQATLLQDQAVLARDRAAQANAADQVRRYEPLVSQGLASAQQVETFKAQAAQLAATVAGDQATIRHDQLILGYATIRAPITGVTGVRLVDAGNVVGPSDASGIVIIAQVQPIAVLFTLPQAAIASVRRALVGTHGGALPVEAVAEGEAQVLDHGQLSVVDNRIDATSGTILLKATFPNAARLLWPGQLITARLRLGVEPAAVTVPGSAVQRNPQGTYVWLVDTAGKAAMRPVTLGMTLADRVIIDRGLNGGERVITDGQFGLTAGARVRIARGKAASAPVKSDNPDQLGITS